MKHELITLVLATLAPLHAATSQPGGSTAVSLEVRAGGAGTTQTATFYRTVRCGDLTVTVLPDKTKPRESPLLQVMGPETPLYTNECATISNPTPRSGTGKGIWIQPSKQKHF